jgi:hypothetical protein
MRVSTLDLLGTGLTLFTGPRPTARDAAPGGALLARPDGAPSGLIAAGADAQPELRAAARLWPSSTRG